MQAINSTTQKITCKNTGVTQENLQNPNCKYVDSTSSYLVFIDKNYIEPNTSLPSWLIENIADTSHYDKPIEQSISKITSFMATIEADLLEKAILTDNKNIINSKVSSLLYNTKQSNILYKILENYIANNKIFLIEYLYNKKGIFTKRTLDILLSYQLKNTSNINVDLIADILYKKIAVSPDQIIEFLSSLQSGNIKNEVIKKLDKTGMLYDILKEAINRDRLDFIEDVYFTHGYATQESLDYLLHNLFSNTFNIELFDKLIDEGADIKEATIENIVNSEDINTIKSIVDLLSNRILHNKVLAFILNNSIKQNKLEIVEMLYLEYNFFSAKSLDYILLNNINGYNNIPYINSLISKGAIIKEAQILKILHDNLQLEVDETFIDFYIKLDQIKFNLEIKDSIHNFLKTILQKDLNILIEENNLTDTIFALYFKHNIVTHDSFYYILAQEPDQKKRHLAEKMFEKKYHYKETLLSFANDF